MKSRTLILLEAVIASVQKTEDDLNRQFAIGLKSTDMVINRSITQRGPSSYIEVDLKLNSEELDFMKDLISKSLKELGYTVDVKGAGLSTIISKAV